jgi:nucleoid-associated protein YgaU
MALATSLSLAPAPTGERSPAASRVHGLTRQSSRRARRRVQQRRPKVGPVGGSHHPAQQLGRARLTRRGVVLCWMAAVLAVLVMAFGLAQGLQTAAPVTTGAQSVTVETGGSLWDIAQRVNPGVDPRVTIEAIREANGLDAFAEVQPGATVSVPVYAPAR